MQPRAIIGLCAIAACLPLIESVAPPPAAAGGESGGWALPPEPLCAPPSETLTLPLPRSDWNRSVEVDDLNRDGLPDIVAADGESLVAVFINLGQARFRARADYVVGRVPADVVVGDLDGDGVPDIATANRGSSTVTSLLGVGDGTFRSRMDIAVAESPVSLAFGDFDADGHVDLISAGWANGLLSMLKGDPVKRFWRAGESVTSYGPTSVTAGDFNGDGNLDAAVAAYGKLHTDYGRISVHLGMGNGGFLPRTQYDDYYGGMSITAADLDLDGNLDLVSAGKDTGGSSGATVAVLMGIGEGQFRDRVLYAVGSVPRSEAVGDLNGDGVPDVAVANYRGGSISVLLGRGDGTLRPAEEIPLGDYPSSIAIADMNGDGKPDVVTAGSKGIAILLNRWVNPSPYPARAFLRASSRTVPVGQGGPGLRVRFQPVEGRYANTDVNLSTVSLVSFWTGGSTWFIYARGGKEIREADTDLDGVSELEAFFAPEDLSRLFSWIRGRRTVSVWIRGCVKSGGEFQARFEMDILGVPPAAQHVSVAPNPLNPDAILTVGTSRTGPISVTIFDAQGRRVRNLAAEAEASGSTTIRLEGKDDDGRPLSSGIYFYRVESPDGWTSGRFTILK